MISVKNLSILIIPVVALLSIALFLSLAHSGNIVEETKPFMGTLVRIKVPVDNSVNETKARNAIKKAFEEIGRIENIFSVYKEKSEISGINRLRKNERLQVSDEAFSLISRSIDISRKTDGAFDITVKPLVDLWDKAKKNNILPSGEDIRAAQLGTGYEKVVLDKKASTISFTRDGMSLDLGAIAKGYAADRAIKILKDNGIKNALVNPGGNVYCLGRRSGKELWKVGVRHPRDGNKTFLEISLEDKAIDTSGDYEKYFTLNGKRYSHIIDPRTGYPTGDSVVSSTVIADDSTTADALATALSVLGVKGVRLLEAMKGPDAVLVFKRNEKFIVIMTEAFKERYDFTEEKL